MCPVQRTEAARRFSRGVPAERREHRPREPGPVRGTGRQQRPGARQGPSSVEFVRVKADGAVVRAGVPVDAVAAVVAAAVLGAAHEVGGAVGDDARGPPAVGADWGSIPSATE